jgi:hypothetical protein
MRRENIKIGDLITTGKTTLSPHILYYYILDEKLIKRKSHNFIGCICHIYHQSKTNAHTSYIELNTIVQKDTLPKIGIQLLKKSGEFFKFIFEAPNIYDQKEKNI